jgi:hypothetical protein
MRRRRMRTLLVVVFGISVFSWVLFGLFFATAPLAIFSVLGWVTMTIRDVRERWAEPDILEWVIDD